MDTNWKRIASYTSTWQSKISVRGYELRTITQNNTGRLTSRLNADAEKNIATACTIQSIFLAVAALV